MFDIKAETEKLRNRSALNYKMILIAILTVGFSIMFYMICVQSQYSGTGWFLVFFTAIMGTAVVISYWIQRKRLINEGVVVVANFQQTTRLPKGNCAVHVTYNVANETIGRTFHMATPHASIVANNGSFLLVALERKPKVSSPLFMFARWGKETDAVLNNRSGLFD